MPSEITPDTTKALLPTTSGTFCEKFKKLIQFPTVLHGLVSYLFNSAGLPSTQFQTDICALGCTFDGGGGTPNPNLAAPTGVNATDGTYSDKVLVSWLEVTPPEGGDPVTQYLVYRALSTITNPNSATLLATVTAPTLQYEDTTAVAGTVYRYWVKARSVTQTSAYSGSDLGSADAPTTTLDAITDLRTTIGFGFTSSVALDWTPPAGATAYDVYRNTANDFATATKIWGDVEPAPTTTLIHPTSNPVCWDNEPRILLYDEPPSITTDYYYFVVAKKSSPPATSDESNSSLGRVNPPAIYNLSTVVLDYTNPTVVVPALNTKAWIVLRGGGAGGAGGGNVYGGGGGGAGATVVEAFTVTPGHTIELITTGATPDTGNAAAGADGDDGAIEEIEINAVSKMITNAGHGGQYNAAGGGGGGAGDTGTGTTSPTIFNGMAGLPAVGSSGGKCGYSFGFRRRPEADAFGAYNGDGDAGGYAGSGAKAIPINGAISIGGHGTPGQAFIVFGT